MKKRSLAGATLLLVLLHPAFAYAYLDPGTGSIAVQAVLAGLVAVLATITSYWTRIRGLFHRRGQAAQDSRPHGEGRDASGETT